MLFGFAAPPRLVGCLRGAGLMSRLNDNLAGWCNGNM